MPSLSTPQVVHTDSEYGHPINWAGYMLVGKDIVLRDRSVELAQSVQMMLQAPLEHLLSTLRTLQAMVRVCVCVCVCVCIVCVCVCTCMLAFVWSCELACV